MAAFIFDGKVGDAAAGIHCAVRQDAAGRAGLDAAPAGPAVVMLERGDPVQRNIQQDLPQQEEGA